MLLIEQKFQAVPSSAVSPEHVSISSGEVRVGLGKAGRHSVGVECEQIRLEKVVFSLNS